MFVFNMLLAQHFSHRCRTKMGAPQEMLTSKEIIWQGCQICKQGRRKSLYGVMVFVTFLLKGNRDAGIWVLIQLFSYPLKCGPVALKLFVTYWEPLLFSLFSLLVCSVLCGWVIWLATPLLVTSAVKNKNKYAELLTWLDLKNTF